MGYLSADDILAAEDLETHEVDVPEWGGTVLVRPFTATERDRYELALREAATNPDNAQIRAHFAGRVMVDGNGKRLFGDKEVGKLGAKNAAPVDRVIDKVREISGMKKGAADKAAEDFGDAPSDGSSSD